MLTYAHFVPGIVLNSLHIFPHLILITMLGSNFYSFYLHFTDEETEAQIEEIVCPRLDESQVRIKIARRNINNLSI